MTLLQHRENNVIGQLDADSFSITESFGGVRGLVETVLPALVYTVGFVITQQVRWPLICALAVGIVAAVLRVGTGLRNLKPALTGLAGLSVCVVWVLISGKGEDFFAFGLLLNAVYGAVVLLSLLLRLPLIGVIINLFRRVENWRANRDFFRRSMWATGYWLGLFILRLAVETPLYLNSYIGSLGAARIVLGLPLYTLVLFMTWKTFAGNLPPRALPPEGVEPPSAA